ncbi:hypothetical protein B0H14DRAFT_3511736 [Mycena olivaceomarginata]|nr:hypothetical protein B0H14DRAFT_3511736 [Mycena olivaceomarginata]
MSCHIARAGPLVISDAPVVLDFMIFTMQQFIPAFLQFRHAHPDAGLVVWKSDVSEAFRLTSVHKLAQIKQIATSNLPIKAESSSGESSGPVQRKVDWCSTFAGHPTFGHR